jgi:hypothetical protein
VDVGPAEIEQSEELVGIEMTAPLTMAGQLQVVEPSPAQGLVNWSPSVALDVPADWPSAIYAARFVDAVGSTCHVPFVVQPAPDRLSPLALLANVTTWCAYNPWGGYSRYGVPGGGTWTFSYLRPLADAFDPTRKDPGYHYASKHQVRGELWIQGWLRDAGYEFDVHTDLDLHAGFDGLHRYRVLVLSTHPEYWSTPMLDALEGYLADGGSLVYLGGNGLYDAVDIAEDLTSISVKGTSGTGRTQLFRHLGRPESAVLGVAFPWDPVDGDIGNNAGSRVSYRVRAADHRFFAGSNAHDGDLIGSEGWCIQECSGSLTSGGASGWECDRRDNATPPDIEVLAEGTNTGTAAEIGDLPTSRRWAGLLRGLHVLRRQPPGGPSATDGRSECPRRVSGLTGRQFRWWAMALLVNGALGSLV